MTAMRMISSELCSCNVLYDKEAYIAVNTTCRCCSFKVAKCF